MSTLNLTHALTAGANENINDVQENFQDVVDWAAGNVSDNNFASTAGMYSAYRTRETHKAKSAALTVGDYLFAEDGTLKIEAVDTSSILCLFYLDDADYAITGRTTKLRLRAQAFTNATAPGITFTAGLFPVSSVTGGAGVNQATLGTVTAGSTVAFSPLASTPNQGNSGDFAFPADGYYALGVNLSASQNANSFVTLSVELQQRWV